MRMASLKTLLALGETRFPHAYGKALKDKSLLVRKQALENIRRMSLKTMAPLVWQMLHNEQNYYTGKGRQSYTNFIRDIIKTVGELKFKRALKPLLSMVQKDQYNGIFPEIEYALAKITGKRIPRGDNKIKRRYWKRVAIANTKI